MERCPSAFGLRRVALRALIPLVRKYFPDFGYPICLENITPDPELFR